MIYKNFIVKLILLLAIPLMFTTCKKNGLGVTMSYQRDFEIPAGLGVFDTHVFELIGIPTNKVAFLGANSIEESEISEIVPEDAELSINFSNVEFDFVGEVIVEIFSIDDPTGREIFFREKIPLNTGIRIDLFPSLPDVKDFLLKDEFSVRVEMKFRDISPQFIETRFNCQFLART